MLNKICLDEMKGKKNLLAFSYGSDSSALFFLLEKEGINFDIAFVNYGTRKNSDIEESEARKLANKFSKNFFCKKAPFFDSNFEKNARDFRYSFFDELCEKFAYENLILAHNLNDKFEWFLMQFSKGAGLLELCDFNYISKRKKYILLRPMLDTCKDEILDFLKKENIFFFKDESNDDEKYFRNRIRKYFAKPFVSEFHMGVKNTFAYLQKDINNLYPCEEKEFNGILLCDIKESVIAKNAKKLGFLLSAKQRKEALKGDCVISHKLGICYTQKKALLFLYEKSERIPKKDRELFRKAKIPPLLRAYLFKHKISLKDFLSFLNS